jgi:hypothetical protein
VLASISVQGMIAVMQWCGCSDMERSHSNRTLEWRHYQAAFHPPTDPLPKRDQGMDTQRPLPTPLGKQREKRRLSAVMVMMMMMVVVMGPGSERGTCKHHQEQHCCKHFLHMTNPSTRRFAGGSTRPRYVSQK